MTDSQLTTSAPAADDTPVTAARSPRVPWRARLALALYWPALMVATHWPRLDLRVDQDTSFGDVYLDKPLHAGAFALLTALLALSRLAGRGRSWRASLIVAGIVAFAYGTLDELTQAGFERTVSLGDLLANYTGIALALWLVRAWTRRAALAAIAAPVPPHPPRSFVGHAMTVSGLTFLSRITGLVRDSCLAAAFGIGPLSDAFWLGFSVPNLFRRLFGEGALTAAFIPVYTELLHKDRQLAKRLASLCLSLTLIVLGLLTIAGELVLGASFRFVEWTPDTSLAIRLTMIMLPYMPLVCLVAIIGAMLQVHGRFAPAAGMPIFLNLVMIAGTAAALFLSRGRGDDAAVRFSVYFVSVSVVLAGGVQLLSQTMLLLRHESLTSAWVGAREPFNKLMGTFLPVLMALAVFQVNTFMDSLLAFGLSPKEGGDGMIHLLGLSAPCPVAPGGNTALQNAQRLYQFPLGVFGIAISTAIFPALAHAAVKVGDAARRDFRRTLQQGLRLTVFIGLPASVGLMLVRVPLVRMIYHYGRVEVQDYLLIAGILSAYAPAIWAYSMTHVVTRAFYALGDSKSPLRVSLWMVVLNLGLNLVLVWPLGAAGLAWSTAICAMVQCVVLLRKLGRKVDQPVDAWVWKGWLRTAGLSVLMALLLLPLVLGFDATALSRQGSLLLLGAMVSGGAALYGVGAWLLRSEEVRWLRGRNP